MPVAHHFMPSVQPRRVVVAPCSGRLLAVDQADIATVTSIMCSPPLPGAAPWVGGLGEHHGRPALVVALFGSSQDHPSRRQVEVLILNQPCVPEIALLMDGTAGFTEATPRPAVERLSAACPADWLRPCRLDDGRQAVLIDAAAIGHAWEAA